MRARAAPEVLGLGRVHAAVVARFNVFLGGPERRILEQGVLENLNPILALENPAGVEEG